MGCADRCSRARVRLHRGGTVVWYSGWLRLPMERRPSRKRLGTIKAKLRSRLEAGLQLVDGQVLKVGVRRCRPRLPVVPILLAMPQQLVSPQQIEPLQTA